MPIKQSPISQRQVGSYSEDLEDEVIRFKTKDAMKVGTWIDHSLIPKGSRIYSWLFHPFPRTIDIEGLTSSWEEIARITLSGIFYPGNATPILLAEFIGIRITGASGPARVRITLVGESGEEVEDEVIFSGYMYGTLDRLYDEVYLSRHAAGTGHMDCGTDKRDSIWCLKIEVSCGSPATGMRLYKESYLALLYEF